MLEQEGPQSARFRKILILMRTASHSGERQAARHAAMRLAERFGMTLEEAVEAALRPRADSRGTDSGWADSRWGEGQGHEGMPHTSAKSSFWHPLHEAREKQSTEAARQAAQQRRESEESSDRSRRSTARYSFRYKPTHKERFRTIAGLLKEGVSIQHIARLLDVSALEIARVYLHNRQSSS